ncbi:MAG: zinc-ribbon domain-containing protein [Clostridia bacterium]|nr:zinc-ribbon domain-containing protein [Clostridia bacterium]
MICPICGAQIENDVAFCTQCGSPIQNNATPEYAPMDDHPTELFSEETNYEMPAYDTAPAYDSAPAYEAAPVYDAAPAYDAAPTYSEPYSYTGTETPAKDPGAGLGKVSKILGIIGLVLMCGWAGAPLSITALILGCIGLSKSKSAGFENKSAKTGRTLGIIGVVLIPVVYIVSFAIGIALGAFESGTSYYY